MGQPRKKEVKERYEAGMLGEWDLSTFDRLKQMSCDKSERWQRKRILLRIIEE